MKYTKLFSPAKIGSIELKNRVAMAGMGSALPDVDGSVNDKVIAYFSERASGGAALLITEVVRVCDGHGLAARYQLSAAHDRLIPKMKELAESVHKFGAKMFFQLHHPGRQTFDDLLDGRPALAPSAVPCPVNNATTRALTVDEIHLLIEAFGDAALRVKKSGIDGIEIHAAHGYLFHQFFSPHINKRNDEYGGNFENCFRFMKEVIDNIRSKCGRNFPISIRLSLDDFVEGSIPLELGLRIAKAVDDLGTIDLINASVGMYEGSINTMLETASYHQGWRNDMLEKLAELGLRTPILAVNCVRSPAFAEWMLDAKLVDVVGLARPFLADPEWVNKVYEDREDEIRPCMNCLYCNESTRGNVDNDAERNSCALNVRNCRETIYPQFSLTGDKRRVVVVGSGPSGLEAARVLSERGYCVTIFEKEKRIGGQLNLAAIPKDKYRYSGLIRYYERQIELLDIDIRIGVAATIELIEELDPFKIFVCTGSTPIIPKHIENINSANVHSVPDILEGKVKLRNRSVAVIGSGNTGLEVAEYVASQDNIVTVIEMLDEIGANIFFQNKTDLLNSIEKQTVNFLTSHRLLSIQKDGVLLQNIHTKKEIMLCVQNIIMALGVEADQSLFKSLKTKFGDYVIPLGDVDQIGRIHNAIYSAFTASYYA